MPRSHAGGRHELGQNFLHNPATIRTVTDLVAHTHGDILELGCGDGALTRPLAKLGRPLTAIDIDEHRVQALRRSLPRVRIAHADATTVSLRYDCIVGNIPFHLTTPVLRRLLAAAHWQHAVLLTQWEVARKRAGVGGGTLMTAQSAPWFTFTLHARVPAAHFRPRPGVDGGILGIERRTQPLVPDHERRAYEMFVRRVFTGSGKRLAGALAGAYGCSAQRAKAHMRQCGIAPDALPRTVAQEQWAQLWHARPAARLR